MDNKRKPVKFKLIDGAVVPAPEEDLAPVAIPKQIPQTMTVGGVTTVVTNIDGLTDQEKNKLDADMTLQEKDVRKQVFAPAMVVENHISEFLEGNYNKMVGGKEEVVFYVKGEKLLRITISEVK